MPRRVPLALAMLSALTGCVAAPPKGPLVEFRAGLTPVTRPVTCPATYVLTAADRPGGPPLAEHHVAKGELLGFRADPGGAVAAVAPGYTISLPPGAYAWEVVSGSVPSWPARVWDRTRETGAATGRATVIVVGACALMALGLGYILVWISFDKVDRRNGGGQRGPTRTN